MSSYWIEQQAQQRFDEFATDARGDQLVVAADARADRPGDRPRLSLCHLPLMWRDWMIAVVARSRRQIARAR